MLVKYEYELLSYIVAESTIRTDGNFLLQMSKIPLELKDEYYNRYLENLENKGMIKVDTERGILTIYPQIWIDFFVDRLSLVFKNCNMDIKCDKLVVSDYLRKSYFLRIRMLGSSKNFELLFNKSNSPKKDGTILMCIPDDCDDIYWLDLINDVNMLNQFYLYLKKEISYINKDAYREINIFAGIDVKYIQQLFDEGIRKYFITRKYKIIDFDEKQCKLLENLFNNNNLSYFGIEINSSRLWILRSDSIIKFISINDSGIFYSSEIEGIISELELKIQKKVSKFRYLIMYKEMNTLDNLLKMISKFNIILGPISLIFSILTLLNIDAVYFIYSKAILILLVVVLSIVQIYFWAVILIPIIKLSIFNWKIK